MAGPSRQDKEAARTKALKFITDAYAAAGKPMNSTDLQAAADKLDAVITGHPNDATDAEILAELTAIELGVVFWWDHDPTRLQVQL